MASRHWLDESIKLLEAAGIGTARLDALVLLEDVTGRDRAWLLAHPEYELNAETVKKLDDSVKRRAGHEPLAYIRGKTEFYGRMFKINKNALEPRPESEPMIDLLKSLPHHHSPRCKVEPCGGEKCVVVDVGTGSGALAISAKLELPTTELVATDIDPKCLTLAKQNAHLHGTAIRFLRGDLIAPVRNKCDILLCNLPYVPDNYTLNKAAYAEPRIAIFGGPDGLDLYRRLFAQITQRPSKPKFVLTESLPTQHKKLARIAEQAGYGLKQTDDFIQVFIS